MALALVACTAAHTWSPPHPSVRSASGGPIQLLGAVAHPGPVPYAPGITLTCALRLVGGPTMFASGLANLTRIRDGAYIVPLRQIIDGDAPDMELAPGDVIVVREIQD